MPEGARADSRSRSPVRRTGGPGPKKSKSILLKNLNQETTIDILRDHFTRFGHIKDIYIPLNYYTQRPKGFAFIEFEDGQDADAAVDEMDGSRILDNHVSCCIAKDQRKSPRTMRKIEGGSGNDRGRDMRDSRRYRRDSRSPPRRRRDSRSRRRRDSRSRSRGRR